MGIWAKREKGGEGGEGTRGAKIYFSKFTYSGSALWVGLLRLWKLVPM